MKGLLLKDFYQMGRYCRTFLLIIAVFLGLSVMEGASLFFSLYPAMLCGILPVTLLSYDERSGWTKFAGTLPCTRAQIVSAKYLLGVIIEIVIIAVSLLVTMAVKGAGASGFMGALVGMMWCAGFLPPAIILPVVFRLGVEKGRMVYLAVVALIAGGAAAVMRTVSIDAAGEFSPAAMGAAALAATVIYALSWLLSVRLYQRKEL